MVEFGTAWHFRTVSTERTGVLSDRLHFSGCLLVVQSILSQIAKLSFALIVGSIVCIAVQGQENGVTVVGAIPSIVPSFRCRRSISNCSVTLPLLLSRLHWWDCWRQFRLRGPSLSSPDRSWTATRNSSVRDCPIRSEASSSVMLPPVRSPARALTMNQAPRTPMAAVLAAVFLFLILLFVAPLFAYVPIPAMAGVIILVAWKLIDFKELWHIMRTSRSETSIAVITFLSTLFIDLEFAIYVGVMLSFLIFLNKSAHPFIGIGAPDPNTKHRVFRNADTNQLVECPQLAFVRMDGPFYFGSVEHVRRRFREIERTRANQKHMLFMVKGVGEIDLPAAELLIEEARRRKRRGGSFHVQAKQIAAIQRLERFHVSEALSTEHVHTSKGDAIAEIVPTLDMSICATCTARIFRECPEPVEIAKKLKKKVKPLEETEPKAGPAVG